MTIVAGFRFNTGIILCADTQETVQNYSKTWTPKLDVKPDPWNGTDSPDDLMVAFAGAGDGPFIDKVTERAWEDVQTATSFDEACSEIERSIKDTHKEFASIFQVGFMPSIELIYGVKMQSQSKLFKAYGPVINEKNYAAAGVGEHLATFLADGMYQRYLPPPQALILAAYILFQCIEHVDGCGGEPHIASLNDSGQSSMIDPARINFVVDQLRKLKDTITSLLLTAPDISIPPANFERELEAVINEIRFLRGTGQMVKELLEIKPKPSTSQTPTGQ